ncbi:hypothetical protein [Streptomyces sp. NPDC020951]|uniref:hypothetical protein n=1 Tax=Streptomyces sp. NPDC020951 TaxID=3365104 RepID=UPI0037B37595
MLLPGRITAGPDRPAVGGPLRRPLVHTDALVAVRQYAEAWTQASATPGSAAPRAKAPTYGSA